MVGTIESADRPKRLLSLDAFRGLIMCLLAINGLAVNATAKKLGYRVGAEAETWTAQIWQWLAFHNSHPQWNSQFYWVGCSLWDLIQPSFMFMVGVAMPYSYASRKKRGDSEFGLTIHALIRAVVLVLLGVFLATRNSGLYSNRMFTNVLAQIGLGYFFVFLLLRLTAKVQIGCGIAVLVGYSLFLTTYDVVDPPPQNSIDSIATLSVPDSIAGQYALYTNGAAGADIKILGLEELGIPKKAAIVPDAKAGNRSIQVKKKLPVHPAGYATLNFVPSMVTMLLGVLAGTLLRSEESEKSKLKRLVVGGVICFTIAIVASFTVCPIVKKIWTPAWVLYSGGIVLWFLAGLYGVVDVLGFRRWTWPFVVVGVNSLAIYLMSSLMKGWIVACLRTYLGKDIFAGNYGPTMQAIAVFFVLWLMCFYLYRNKIFFRI